MVHWWAVQQRLNWSRCCLGADPCWHRLRNNATWRIWLNDPCAAAMRPRVNLPRPLVHFKDNYYWRWIDAFKYTEILEDRYRGHSVDSPLSQIIGERVQHISWWKKNESRKINDKIRGWHGRNRRFIQLPRVQSAVRGYQPDSGFSHLTTASTRSSPPIVWLFVFRLRPVQETTGTPAVAGVAAVRGVVLKKKSGMPETRLRQRFTVT